MNPYQSPEAMLTTALKVTVLIAVCVQGCQINLLKKKVASIQDSSRYEAEYESDRKVWQAEMDDWRAYKAAYIKEREAERAARLAPKE